MIRVIRVITVIRVIRVIRVITVIYHVIPTQVLRQVGGEILLDLRVYGLPLDPLWTPSGPALDPLWTPA
jgi:hypothetical protein